MNKDLEIFLDKALNISWKNVNELSSFNLSDESVIKLITDKEVYKTFAKRISVVGNTWYVSTILGAQIFRLKNVPVDILEKSLNDDIVIRILRAGHFPDVSYINNVAKSRTGEAQVYAAHYCDIETLKEIRRSKNSKVRAVAYQRLGPVNYLDEMLSDRKKEVRIMGLEFAPINYPFLSKMVGELSLDAFRVLISKVNINDIPLFLGNRNMKHRFVKSVVEQRMQ